MFRVSSNGSIILLFFIGIAFLSLEEGVPTTINATMAAQWVGLGLLISVLLDARYGIRNVFRADILALLGVYFLTLFEFLFEQELLNFKISSSQAYDGLRVILIGLFFLVIGRHLYRPPSSGVFTDNNAKITDLQFFRLYLICALLGFLYILIKVNFDPVRMMQEAMGIRFSQSWSRGRLGGWFVFLSELQLFTYAIPPLAGILINHRKNLSGFQYLLLWVILVITLFMGFAGGTRNVFFSYLAGFLGGYILSMPVISFRKLIIPGAISIMLAYFASAWMVEFRTIGLRNFINGEHESTYFADNTVYVDHNLYSIGVLVQAFPEVYDFLGTEVITWAILKPVPRALWPGKPEGLSISMEEVAGIEGYTLASTYIGESYMAGGVFAVIITSLFFGYLAAWWNGRAASPTGEFNNQQLLIYALGLFAAGITMRSLFMFTTAILPIIGVNTLIRYLKRRELAKSR